ncbi:MAG: hypothetical protein WAU47_03325 [Desulfobaccales bacterium]
MTSDAPNQGGTLFSAILRFLKIFTLNSWRRLLILGRYLLIGFQNLRLRRAWRLLGKRMHQVMEGGETNPMATEEVQNSLTRVQTIQGAKDRQYQVIAALRGKIRGNRAGEAPAPPEAEPAAAGDDGPEKS